MEASIYFGSEKCTRPCTAYNHNPFSGAVVSARPICTPEDVDRAMQIAQKAARIAKRTPLYQRVAWLEDVAANMEAAKEEFARTIVDEVGKPLQFARAEVARAIETIRLSVSAMLELGGQTFHADAMPSGKEAIAYYTREPVGVVACITPFNFPLNLAMHKVAPALIAGNAVVIKPTSEAPLTAYKMCMLFIESPHAIPDVVSLLYGDAEVGGAMVSHPIPRVISFTGSVPVGRIITQNAGIKKVSLELGGNAATYVDASADLELAAKRCAIGAFYNAGQVCISLQRIYVHAAVAAHFTELLAAETALLAVGSPYAEETFVGPLINEEAAMRAERWVQSAIQEGARALCGGRREGRIFYPTVMADVTEDMAIVCEEVFAPIVSVIAVPGYEEALRMMNDSPYGLQFSIFTQQLAQVRAAIRDMECGGVVINDMPTIRFDIQPYGGSKLSGIGREGPKYAIEEFTETKSVVIF